MTKSNLPPDTPLADALAELRLRLWNTFSPPFIWLLDWLLERLPFLGGHDEL